MHIFLLLLFRFIFFSFQLTIKQLIKLEQLDEGGKATNIILQLLCKIIDNPNVTLEELK